MVNKYRILLTDNHTCSGREKVSSWRHSICYAPIVFVWPSSMPQAEMIKLSKTSHRQSWAVWLWGGCHCYQTTGREEETRLKIFLAVAACLCHLYSCTSLGKSNPGAFVNSRCENRVNLAYFHTKEQTKKKTIVFFFYSQENKLGGRICHQISIIFLDLYLFAIVSGRVIMKKKWIICSFAVGCHLVLFLSSIY